MQRRSLLGWLTAAGALPQAVLAQDGGGRVALVVGQSRLPGGGNLPSAPPDAELMEQALQRVGFSVARLDDPDAAALRIALAQLGERLRRAPGLAMLHYSGAGFAQPLPGGWADFWMWCAVGQATPSDAKAAMAQSVSLAEVWRAVNPDRSRALVVTVDSMYNWPFGPDAGARLKWSDPPRDTALMSGDAPGALRSASLDGQHGRFTQELARHVQQRLTVEQLRLAVLQSVLRASGGRQFVTSTMDADVETSALFAEGASGARTAVDRPTPPASVGDDPKGRGRSARVF